MRSYEIWTEGYLCTGTEGIPTSAHFWGACEGTDFKDACCRFADKNGNFAINFDPAKMTHWSCRLYDNQEDAQRWRNEVIAKIREKEGW